MHVTLALAAGDPLEADFPDATASDPGEALAWLLPHPPEWLLDATLTGEDASALDVLHGTVAEGHEADARAALGLPPESARPA